MIRLRTAFFPAVALLFVRLAPAQVAPSYNTTIQGSAPIHRNVTDTVSSTVDIYVGGSLPSGTRPVAFQFLYDETTAGNKSGFITPLLFEYKSVEASTVYTVVAIGRGFPVQLSPSVQTIPFEVIAGIKVTTGNLFTFGFISASVDANGIPVQQSQGVVDFDTPSDTGQGSGGAGTTNDWLYNTTVSVENVSLGRTFGLSNADQQMGLPYRTYAAQIVGIVP